MAASGVCEPSDECVQLIRGHDTGNKPSLDGDSVKQSEQPVELSKRKLKRLKKTEKWEENKLRKRAEERARKKERRKHAREQGLELAPSRKSLKRITMAGSSCHQRVVVDCSFDDLMVDKDIANIVRQINHCYAVNRRTENPVQFYVTGVEKKMKARLDSLKDSNFWDVNFSGQSYLDLFNKSDIVYLSSDSDNILQTLDEQKVYVIGGLIDHNHHKGLCLKLANEKGLSHARLPITDYVQFNTRKVLTVNQVFEILVGYTEKRDWEYAFLKAIPKRKDAMAKRTATEGACSNTNSENKKFSSDLSSKNLKTDLDNTSESKDFALDSFNKGACVSVDTNNEGACDNASTVSCNNSEDDSDKCTKMDIGVCENSETVSDMTSNSCETEKCLLPIT